MRTPGVWLLFLLVPLMVQADRRPGALTVRGQGPDVRIALSQTPVAPVAGMRYRLWVESSSDLHGWERVGELDATELAWSSQNSGDSRGQFFRLRPEIVEGGGAVDGAAVFGYDRVFEEELARIGYLTPREFADLHPPSPRYQDRLTFDPRSARYWDAFNADPAVVNQGKTTNSPGWRATDFQLNPVELEVFLRQGFVVSERLASYSFANQFYRVFTDDLPVFVSADSVLHAWHFSYQHMLSEFEETVLSGSIGRILDSMAERMAAIPAQVRDGPLQVGLQDADYFVAVARSLLASNLVSTVLAPNPRVAETLAAINRGDTYLEDPGFEMFGAGRLVDFTQFRPRSYYTRSKQLINYFRTLMWTGRTDLRVFDKLDPAQSRREFTAAVALCLLLQEGGRAEEWRQLDQIINLFVGQTDAMNYGHLQPLLAAAGIDSLGAVKTAAQIDGVWLAIQEGDLGASLISGDVRVAPLGPEQAQLPRAFVFTGQRFIADGWALEKVTFGRIQWPEDIPGVTVMNKVLRRVPTALDVAYSVLGNRAIGDWLADAMLKSVTPGQFRDGFPYAHSLMAVAATFDRLTPETWQGTLYNRWLWALRALSASTTGAEFPEAMRTRAWSMRLLNAQMASYTELKHDTLLYGKQPYADLMACDYPAGFVEPLPELWRRMGQMAEAAAAGLEKLPAPKEGVIIDAELPPQGTFPVYVYLPGRHAARVGFCRRFAGHMATLERLAGKELRQEPFTAAEEKFIRGLMNSQDRVYEGPTFDGWYPELFYKDYALETGTADMNGSNKADALVADIFTAPPDRVDAKGGVLHEATGGVDLLFIAVDSGWDRMMYAGPVMSHYEFLEPGPVLKRLTDAEWQIRLGTSQPRPEWTKSYLVPRP